MLFLIYLYQRLFRPFVGSSCRFHPTCSDFAKLAISKYGPFKGSRLALLRLLKCHPFHKGGEDRVP
ncbi:MAG: membrane protein insertion efficiency factor YidD [Parachlamydiales bacterium]